MLLGGPDAGPHPPGVAMPRYNRYAYIEAASFVGCCFLAGATLGILTAIARGQRS